MYLSRHIERLARELFSHFSVLTIQGGRQVGKSTLVENVWNKGLTTITFDPIQDVLGARQDPDLFLETYKPPLFLDEIQYAPELLPAIKRKVDIEKKNGMYILSGSQNLGVLRSISESLAGRVALLDLHPMSQRELDGDLDARSILRDLLEGKAWDVNSRLVPRSDLFRRIWRGGYPGLIPMPDHLVRNFYDSYIKTYIERDVRVLSNIQNLQEFGNFISALSALSATEINQTELGRELDIHRKTAKEWLSIAQYSYQWVEVQPFSKNLIKRISKRNKGYFLDTGIICHLQKIPSPESILGSPMKGRLFETFVVTEIMKNLNNAQAPGFFHYRTNTGMEVDLILEWNGKYHPIEIKLASHPRKSDTKGIYAFYSDIPEEQQGNGLLICTCERPFYLTNKIIAIPWWMV
ncbi:MAG: ATP-binding protein [Leptospira sp.]|nr:ATP-binding protein [Leptospira sp.]